MLSWGEKFTLIDHFGPSDNEICITFGISIEELNAARKLRADGLVIPRKVNLDNYSSIFDASMDLNSLRFSHKTKNHPPTKRGRKTTKVDVAYSQLPFIPTPLVEYCQRYGISEHVMHQPARFDNYKQKGVVKIKKIKDNTGTKVSFIWRVQPS